MRGHETTGREVTRHVDATPADPHDSRRDTELRRDAAGQAASLSPLRGTQLPQARQTPRRFAVLIVSVCSILTKLLSRRDQPPKPGVKRGDGNRIGTTLHGLSAVSHFNSLIYRSIPVLASNLPEPFAAGSAVIIWFVLFVVDFNSCRFVVVQPFVVAITAVAFYEKITYHCGGSKHEYCEWTA